jgi:hypothetical protein
MRFNHSLSQELENLRQDIDLIKDQLLALKHSLSSGLGMSSKSYHQNNGHISANGRRNVIHLINPNRVEKLKRYANYGEVIHFYKYHFKEGALSVNSQSIINFFFFFKTS